MPREKKTLLNEVSLPGKLILIGVALCVASLFLPAAKHGKVIWGLECFSLGTIVGLTGSSNGEDDMTVFCRVAVAANACAGLMAVLGVSGKLTSGWCAAVMMCVLVVCVGYLYRVPYAGIETVYVGYYVWLAGLCFMGLGGATESIKPVRSL